MAFVISLGASPTLSLPVNFCNPASRSPQGRSGVAIKCLNGTCRPPDSLKLLRHPKIEFAKLKENSAHRILAHGREELINIWLTGHGNLTLCCPLVKVFLDRITYAQEPVLCFE
jgi:hypothetical protein